LALKSWLTEWVKLEKEQAVREKRRGHGHSGSHLAPQIGVDCDLSVLKNMWEVTLALERTAMEWIWTGKAQRTMIEMLVGCSLQLHDDLHDRKKILKDSDIAHLREELKKMLQTHPQMSGWEFWDGMDGNETEDEAEDGNSDQEEDSDSSLDETDQVDMRDLPDCTNPEERQEMEVRRQISAKGQKVDLLLQEQNHRNLVLNSTKSLWNILQQPNVATVNIGEDNVPYWVMSPQIYKKTLELVEVLQLCLLLPNL
jgi:hypothetical protein